MIVGKLISFLPERLLLSFGAIRLNTVDKSEVPAVTGGIIHKQEYKVGR